MKKKITGWGNNISVKSKIYQPSSIKDAEQFLKNFKSKILARGFGKSYGDTALNKKVISLLKLKKILNFDKKNGIIEVESGISVETILKKIIPYGWFLPVISGSQFISVGGALSCDVHGKNHHQNGCFSNHCISLTFLDNNGNLKQCSPKKNKKYFHAICGGVGLVGIIVKVRLKLIKIKSNLIKQKIVKKESIKSCIESLEKNEKYKYSVSWIDFLNKNKYNDHNCVIFYGDHYNKKTKLKFIQNTSNKIMVYFLKIFFSLNIMKLFNILKFKSIVFNEKENLIDYKKFFFPLDNILNWNLIYGNQGFLQYQFVISKKNIYKIINKINELNLKPILVVLKLFGKENKNLLSFPKKGITIAMDLFNSKKNISKLNILTKYLILNDGRVYLAKDSIINHKDFRKMYPNWTKFEKLKSRGFISIQSKRLKI